MEGVTLKYQESRSNIYNVPLRQWRKWKAAARQVFNEVYSAMRGAQWAFLHPKQDCMSAQKWKTVAWNSAWVSADATNKVTEMK